MEITRAEIKQRIRELRDQGYSYQRISEALNVDKSYAWRVVMGKDQARPRKRAHDLPPALTEEQLQQRFASIELGAITEALICVRLMMLGFDVWRSFLSAHRSDLGVLIGSRLVRIQAKTASYDAPARRFRTPLHYRRRGIRQAYGPTDFDFFIIKCAGLEEYYVMPAQVGINARFVNLYPNRERLMEVATDYEVYRNAFHLLKTPLEPCDVEEENA